MGKSRVQKFPDKLTIVLKKRTNQGFIALDEKSVESGINWAGSSYRDKNGELDYELLEYENGKFKLKLSKAAERSYSQGGKLSFWTLEVTAPDGKVFNVGINSDSLAETLFETTTVKGEIKGSFYLGRTNSQQSITQKKGLYYKEYEALSVIKKIPLTKKYKVGNTILHNREEYKFIGEFPRYIMLEEPDRQDYYRGTRYSIKLSKYPKPKYSYLYIIKRKSGGFSDYIIFDDKKISGRITDDSTMNSKNLITANALAKLKTKLTEAANKETFSGYASRYAIEQYLILSEISEVEDAIEEFKKFKLDHLLNDRIK